MKGRLCGAKRTKRVRARLDSAKDVNGNKMAILRIGKNTIGEIQTIDDHLAARSNKGKIFHVKNISEGLEDLLSEYHLHKK